MKPTTRKIKLRQVALKLSLLACISTILVSNAKAQRMELPVTVLRILNLDEPDTMKVKRVFDFTSAIYISEPELIIVLVDTCVSILKNNPHPKNHARAI